MTADRVEQEKSCSIKKLHDDGAESLGTPPTWKGFYIMNEINIVRRGEIYIAHLGRHEGSVQGGTRPVLVLQNNCGNYYSPTTIIAPITTKKSKSKLPVHVNLDGCDCLEPGSKVLLEQIRTIDKSCLRQYICSLYPDEMAEVEKALLISVGMGDKEVQS